MFNSEEPPRKKKKQESSPWQSPPDDIIINCLTRVSVLEYANLYRVSKSYRSLVTSSYLHKTRSLMDCKETNVYVCLRTPQEPENPKWYILRSRDEFNLIPIPSLPSQPPDESSVVVLDWGLYLIGGLINKNPTSSVWVLDCRTHTWRRLPSMKVARAKAAVGVVDGKIYVFGGQINIGESSSWGEVFDPKTRTWDSFEKTQNFKGDHWPIWSSMVVDKKVYAMDGMLRFIYYSPSENKWGRCYLPELLDDRTSWCIGDCCMIDNILYCHDSFGSIYWFEPDELNRVEPYQTKPIKEVKGLKSLKKSLFNSRLVHFNEEVVASWDQKMINDHQVFKHKYVDLFPGSRMSNYGENIILFWDVIEGDRLEIWCAEISLERRQDGEVWGNILRSKVVMSIDHFIDRYKVLYSVSVTL